LDVIAGTPLSLLQANTPYLLDALRAGAPGTMSIASIWLPDLVGDVIAKEKAHDADAERLHACLCAMEMVERAVHPAGLKRLLAKRGIPILPLTRTAHAPLSLEACRALDYCAASWFDPNGELRL
jgi:dihydrodipicolinate synthase/N-acetylneuraminate lyase